ncbi:MAG: hypothetical protein ACR2PG_06505 [Hyphomicrobiaceae bacterium]
MKFPAQAQDHSSNLSLIKVLAGAWLSALALHPHQPAEAQDSAIPGLIVSVPPASDVPVSPTTERTIRRPAAPQTLKKQANPSKQQTTTRRRRSTPATANRRRKHSVAVLVNDEPITHHEIDQRAKLIAANSNVSSKAKMEFERLINSKATNNRVRAILQETISSNPGKTRDQIIQIFNQRKAAYGRSLQQRAIRAAQRSSLAKVRSRAKKELIEERLKLQAAKENNSVATPAQVNAALEQMAKRSKTTVKALLRSVTSTGVYPQTFKERIKAQISWQGVVRKKFGRTIAINLKDVDQQVTRSQNVAQVGLKLQTITLELSEGSGQTALARRLHDANTLLSQFKGCKTTRVLAKQVPSARFKDLGTVKASTISEPTRSLIIQALDGEMAPPVATSQGVVLYAVCGRTANTGTAQARARTRSEFQRREFSSMARRHLADLRRDAHIEYK